VYLKIVFSYFSFSFDCMYSNHVLSADFRWKIHVRFWTKSSSIPFCNCWDPFHLALGFAMTSLKWPWHALAWRGVFQEDIPDFAEWDGYLSSSCTPFFCSCWNLHVVPAGVACRCANDPKNWLPKRRGAPWGNHYNHTHCNIYRCVCHQAVS
jgi:hypothetical protein